MKVAGQRPTSDLEYNKDLAVRDMNFSTIEGVGRERRKIATISKANNDAA